MTLPRITDPCTGYGGRASESAFLFGPFAVQITASAIDNARLTVSAWERRGKICGTTTPSKAIYDALSLLAANDHGVSVTESKSLRRGPALQARQSVWHKLRQHGYSYPGIGKVAHRDHTTILAGVRRHAEVICA